MEQVTLPDILTLKEVSEYLRLPAEIVLRQALQGNLPGRKIEHEWRFLKVAIDDWLRSQNSSSILLQQTGALADDEFEVLAEQLADDFAACVGSDALPLSDYAVSREGIYEGHP